MILRAALATALLLPAVGTAQVLERPADWVVRPNDPAAGTESAVRFVAMPPGGHDGFVGLVAGADVNLHVTRLDVTPLEEDGPSAAGGGIAIHGPESRGAAVL